MYGLNVGTAIYLRTCFVNNAIMAANSRRILGSFRPSYFEKVGFINYGVSGALCMKLCFQAGCAVDPDSDSMSRSGCQL